MIWRGVDDLVVVQGDLHQVVAPHMPRRLELGHDDSAVGSDRIAKENLPRLTAQSHLLERGGGAIDQRDAGVPAKTPCIRAFSQADGEHTSGNAQVLHGSSERKRVGRDDADIAFEIDEGPRVEGLRIHDGAVDVGEDLEFVGAAHIVAIARGAVRHDALAIGLANLPRLEGLDHGLLGSHAPDPVVTLDRHAQL